MSSTHLARPIPPPEINIPHSSTTVDLRVIDTDTLLYIDPKLFWEPELKGFKGQHAPVYCFLISHSDRHIVFDLGVRADWEHYAPKIVALIKATTSITPGKDVASVLDSNTDGPGIRSSDVEAVIWSHNHFDHIGDPSTFPLSTELVVGTGVKAASWPGYPQKADAGVLDSDARGRNVREISFDSDLRVGRFKAFDYFQDGSFYLLEAPGHSIGHMCALARTTAGPSSFVLLGADACHHPGLLRPSEYLPLPTSITLPHSTRMENDITPCPGHCLQMLIPGHNPSAPFFTVSRGLLFPDHEAAMETVRKIQELDASEDVFVVIAHDLSLSEKIPLYPQKINGWRASDLGSATRWLFCGELESAVNNRHCAYRSEN